MVSIITYRAYWEGLRERVSGIDRLFFSLEADDIQRIAADITGEEVVLMVLLPSSTGEGRQDSYGDVNNGEIYLLCKASGRDTSIESFWDAAGLLQPIVEKIKETMESDKSSCCSVMEYLSMKGIVTEMVRNVHAGLAGWYVSFRF
jgi:hypothetical protein